MTTLERSWTHDEREKHHMLPAEGPWADEPDKVQWVDPATGLDCLIVRNRMGAWCGYVGVPPGHRAHGRDYGDARVALVSVHGGLTFAGGCDEDAPEGHGICHVPFEGRPGDVWWFGFDCGHAWDLVPGFTKYAEDLPHMFGPDADAHYWTVADVRAEVTRLAEQLADTPHGVS